MTAKDTLSPKFHRPSSKSPRRFAPPLLAFSRYTRSSRKRYVSINPPLVLFLAPQGLASIAGQVLPPPALSLSLSFSLGWQRFMSVDRIIKLFITLTRAGSP